jgi:hypothetical protein
MSLNYITETYSDEVVTGSRYYGRGNGAEAPEVVDYEGEGEYDLDEEQVREDQIREEQVQTEIDFMETDETEPADWLYQPDEEDPYYSHPGFKVLDEQHDLPVYEEVERVPPTEEEMQIALEFFLNLCKGEREEAKRKADILQKENEANAAVKERMAKHIRAYLAAKVGPPTPVSVLAPQKSIETMYSDLYPEMISKAYEQAMTVKKAAAEKDRLAAVQQTEKDLVSYSDEIRLRGKIRNKEKSGPNSQGRVFGSVIIDQATIDKQKARAAARREKRKEEKAQEDQRAAERAARLGIVEPVTTGCHLVQQDEVDPELAIEPVEEEYDLSEFNRPAPTADRLDGQISDIETELSIKHIVVEQSDPDSDSTSECDDVDDLEFALSMNKTRNIEPVVTKQLPKPVRVVKPVVPKTRDISQFNKDEDRVRIASQALLTKTKLCRSVTDGVKCYHRECRFAHGYNELKKQECRFGNHCRFVEQRSDSSYNNCGGDRLCIFWHPNESNRSFAMRMGYKIVPVADKQIEIVKPVKQTQIEKPKVPMVSKPAPNSVWGKHK